MSNGTGSSLAAEACPATTGKKMESGTAQIRNREP